MIYDLDKDNWVIYIIYFLKDNVLSSEFFYTDIYKDKDLIIIDDNKYLLCKINDDISSYVFYVFRVNFIEQMHSEYNHFKYSELLEVINDYDW